MSSIPWKYNEICQELFTQFSKVFHWTCPVVTRCYLLQIKLFVPTTTQSNSDHDCSETQLVHILLDVTFIKFFINSHAFVTWSMHAYNQEWVHTTPVMANTREYCKSQADRKKCHTRRRPGRSTAPVFPGVATQLSFWTVVSKSSTFQLIPLMEPSSTSELKHLPLTNSTKQKWYSGFVEYRYAQYPLTCWRLR